MKKSIRNPLYKGSVDFALQLSLSHQFGWENDYDGGPDDSEDKYLGLTITEGFVTARGSLVANPIYRHECRG